MVADEVQTFYVSPALASLSPPTPPSRSAKLKTVFGTRTPFGLERKAGLGLLRTAAGTQPFKMSQVLFQQLVPLLVKCKDCEER